MTLTTKPWLSGVGVPVATPPNMSKVRQEQLVAIQQAMRDMSDELASHTHEGTAGKANLTLTLPIDVEDGVHRIKMLCVRLRCHESRFPFNKFATFVEGEKVFITIILNGQSVNLEDEAALYPSDNLMSQLRLLIP